MSFLILNVFASMFSGAAGRALGNIISKFKSLKNIGFETFSKLYHSGVLPIMDYCAGMSGYENLVMCQRIQQHALRFYLGFHPKTPLLALEGDTGWIHPNVRRHTEMLMFWNRVLNMDESRLTRKMFEYDYKMCKKNWCNDMKKLFNILGKMSIVEGKTLCNVRELQICNHNIWKDKWKHNVPNKPKPRTYISFIEQYYTDDYVKLCIPILAQIRFGILPLHIETGRVRGTALEERTCQICNSQSIEDEFHFILFCNQYNEMRINLFNSIKCKVETFEYLDNREEFVHIMKYDWKCLSKYTVKAWAKRNSKLNIITG